MTGRSDAAAISYRLPSDTQVPGDPDTVHLHPYGLPTSGFELIIIDPTGYVKVFPVGAPVP